MQAQDLENLPALHFVIPFTTYNNVINRYLKQYHSLNGMTLTPTTFCGEKEMIPNLFRKSLFLRYIWRSSTDSPAAKIRQVNERSYRIDFDSNQLQSHFFPMLYFKLSTINNSRCIKPITVAITKTAFFSKLTMHPLEKSFKFHKVFSLHEAWAEPKVRKRGKVSSIWVTKGLGIIQNLVISYSIMARVCILTSHWCANIPCSIQHLKLTITMVTVKRFTNQIYAKVHL